MSAERIVVALLAAGRSTRFGSADKLAAPLGDKPLLQWAADAGHSLSAHRRLLVQSAESSVSAAGYDPLINTDAALGMSTSLGIAAKAAERCGATMLVILLADMPFVQPGHLGALLAAFEEAPSRPVFSVTAGTPPQPPALFPSSLFPALQSLEGDKGARGFARDATLVTAAPEHLLDIDTPEELDRARAYLASLPINC